MADAKTVQPNTAPSPAKAQDQPLASGSVPSSNANGNQQNAAPILKIEASQPVIEAVKEADKPEEEKEKPKGLLKAMTSSLFDRVSVFKSHLLHGFLVV